MTRTFASLFGIALLLAAAACVRPSNRHEDVAAPPRHEAIAIPDTRIPVQLPAGAAQEHRAVMLQHLETVQHIVAALADEEFERAQGLAETHLGFFMHRQAMARQHPEDFPPAYHDLAMAHHQAAEDLARIIPSRDLKKIMPGLDGLLKVCVACHLEYRIIQRG
jgi:hypothetical protein